MKESNESLIETAKSMTLTLIKVGGNVSLTQNQLSYMGITIDDIEIPKVIEDEIKSKMSKSGCYCGEIELVEEKDDNLEEQDSDISFCEKEYAKQTTDANGTKGVIFFPYNGFYIKVPYVI
jgi:hypothetical protein